MSRHDPLVRLRHMLDHAEEAVALLGDMSLDSVTGSARTPIEGWPCMSRLTRTDSLIVVPFR